MIEEARLNAIYLYNQHLNSDTMFEYEMRNMVRTRAHGMTKVIAHRRYHQGYCFGCQTLPAVAGLGNKKSP
jgi:hypothetical protein